MATFSLSFQPCIHGRILYVALDKTGHSAVKSRQRVFLSTFNFLIFLCFVWSSLGYAFILTTQSRLFQSADKTVFIEKVHATATPSSLWLTEKCDDDGSDASDLNFMKDLVSRSEEIQAGLVRDRLEKANTKDFLKRKPRKLPYDDARRWVQANLGPNTKEEFYDLVENGNLRTPYIPKRPEEYYTGTREWISWDHFLTGIFDKKQPSAVRPSSGIFD